MPIAKHVHRLHRYKYPTRIIQYCVLPDCTFKSNPAFLIGKKSICNRCGKEFLLNEYSVKLAKPHCEDCHKLAKPKQKNIEEQVTMPTLNEIATAIENAGPDANPSRELFDRIAKVHEQEDSLASRLSRAIQVNYKEDDEEEI